MGLGLMACNVVVLHPRESVRQDAETISAIYRNLGPQAADDVVFRAYAELASALTDVTELIREHQLANLSRPLRRLQLLAENLGLASLSFVTGDLRQSLLQQDSTAFAAIWARLVRISAITFDMQRSADQSS